MPVEMILDHWNPSKKRYRARPTCKVPGRKGLSYNEEDWVDKEATTHRGPED